MKKFEKIIDNSCAFVIVVILFAIIVACAFAASKPQPKRYKLQDGLKQIDEIHEHLGLNQQSSNQS